MTSDEIRDKVLHLAEAGFGLSQMASMVGISKQDVRQIVAGGEFFKPIAPISQKKKDVAVEVMKTIDVSKVKKLKTQKIPK
jgi:hypothetical protein